MQPRISSYTEWQGKPCIILFLNDCETAHPSCIYQEETKTAKQSYKYIVVENNCTKTTYKRERERDWEQNERQIKIRIAKGF